MNRCIYLLPMAALLGYVVGSWGSSEELRAMKELSGAEKKASAQKRHDGFDAFTHLAKIPETARRPRKNAPPRAAVKRPVIAVTNAPKKKEAPNTDATAVEKEAEVAPREAQNFSPDDLRARIAEAQDMWALRVDMARKQWKTKLNLSGKAEKEFDDALQEMNENLYMSAANIAERLAADEKITQELGLRLIGDTTAIMVETYERIGGCVAPEQRGEVSTMQMVDFIDPAVAEPLIDVQDKLREIPMQMRGGRR